MLFMSAKIYAHPSLPAIVLADLCVRHKLEPHCDYRPAQKVLVCRLVQAPRVRKAQ